MLLIIPAIVLTLAAPAARKPPAAGRNRGEEKKYSQETNEAARCRAISNLT